MKSREEMIAELNRLDMIAELEAMDAAEAQQPEKPSVGRGIAAASTSALARGGSSILDTVQDTVYSTPPLGRFSGFARPSVDLERPEGGGLVQPVIDALRDVGNTEAMVMQQARPEGALTGFGYDAGVALMQMVPSIATGFVTKNPNLALSMMGIPAYGNAYEETLLEGGTTDQAIQDGVISLMTELGPEKLFGVWEKALGVQSAKDLLATMAREAFSEVTTEELNLAYDVLRGRDVGDTADILQRFGHAGLLGAVLGGGMSLPNYLGNKLAGTEEAPPPPAEPTKTPEQMVQEALEGEAANEAALPQPELRPAGVDVAVEETPTMVGESEVVKAMQLADRLAADQARQRVADRLKAEQTASVREIQPVEQEEAPLPARTEPETFEEIDLPPKPPELMEELAAKRIRIDRRKFGGDLAETENIRIGNRWLFEGKNSEFQDQGMGPEELLEFMVENGYMPQPDPNKPTQYNLHDAVELLNQAIRGERVASVNYDQQWAEYDDAVRYNDEIARAQFEAETESTPEEVDAVFDEIYDLPPELTDAEIEALADQYAAREDEYVDEAAEAEKPVPEGLGIPEATPQETTAAAVRAKDAERNRLGEDVVPVEQGEGELFAGNEPGVRPEQTDLVEQANETASEVQETNETAVEGQEDNAAPPEYVEKALQGIEFTPKRLKLLEQIWPIDIKNDFIQTEEELRAIEEQLGVEEQGDFAAEQRQSIIENFYGATKEEINLLAKQLRSGRNLIARRDDKGKLVHPKKRVREMLNEEFNTPENQAEWEEFGLNDDLRKTMRESSQQSKNTTWPVPEGGTRKLQLELGKDYLPQEEIDSIHQEWTDYAENVRKTEDHSNDVVLSLYDFSGHWPLPWAQAGYDVHLFDVNSGFDLVRNISDLLQHIEELQAEGKNIVCVLGAPPCNSFTRSGQWSWADMHDNVNTAEVFQRYGRWAAKHFQSPLEYSEAMVDILEMAIEMANPEVHAMENPAVGRIQERMALPDPAITFHPNHFGDNYTKHTALWGNFDNNLPTANADPTAGSKMQAQLSGAQQEERQETPIAFAYSFFVAQHKAMAAKKDGNKIVKKDAADAARDRLKSKLGTLRSGVDPEMLKDLAIVGAYHVEKGARTFAKFSKAMVSEFGDRIKPYLQDIWTKVAPPETEAAPAPEPEKPKAKPQPTRPDPYTGEQTSTKNAVTDAERAARDLDPIMREARTGHNAEVIAKAEQAMKNNPDLADEIVDRLNNDPDPSIDVLTEAVLFVHKVDMRREMRRLAAKAAEGNTTSAARYAELLARQHEIDVATHATGAVWGRLGQLRSRMMNEDYSFEAQIERFQSAIGAVATPEQTAFIKQQAAEIERLTAELEKANQKAQDAIEKYESERVHDNLVRETQRQPKRTVKQKLREARNAEIEWLKNNAFGTVGSGIPAQHMAHLAKLGSIIIAEGAVNIAEFAGKLKQYLGAKLFKQIENEIDTIYEAAKGEKLDIDASGEFELRGVASERQEIAFEIEALSEIGEELSHSIVYKLARSFILGGMRGEKQVMAAVHKVLEPHFDVTERDVRRLFSEYGKAKFPSQEEDKKALRELRALVRIQESIDRLKEGKDPLRTGPQRDKQTQKIREKQQILNQLMRRRQRANPTPSREKLASIDEQRIRRLENAIKDLQRQLDGGAAPKKRTPVPDSPEVKRLKAKRDALKRRLQEIEDAKKPKLSEEEKYNVLRGKQLRRELAEVAQRLRDKDYAPRKRKEPPPLDQANRDLKTQVIQAKIKLHEKQQDWLREDWPRYKKYGDYISQSINLSRAAMTSIDLSAVLRQGGFGMLSNPSTAIKSFIPMMKALKNDANANAVNDEILSRPNADLYQKAKLHLSEQDSAHPTKMEEVYMGRWQKKVPGIAASGRAYVTFLNKLRADSFDAAVEHFTSKGQALTMEELRQLASFINNHTGRFDLTKTGKVAGQGLSNIFFAPRWMLSRFAMIAGQPLWHSSPRMRRYIAKQYAKFLMGYSTLFGLAALGFAGTSDDEDEKFWELDPRSTDFGKMKMGNTRMDMMAGLSQPIVFLSRIISGGKKNQKGEIVPLREGHRFGVPEGSTLRFGQDDGMDVAWNFVRSKFAPPISAISNAVAGKNVVGETYEERATFTRDVLGLPVGIAENPALIETLGLATPLSMRDFYDALIEHGLPKAAALQVLATLGVSMNTYSIEQEKKKGRPERPERPKRPSRPERG